LANPIHWISTLLSPRILFGAFDGGRGFFLARVLPKTETWGMLVATIGDPSGFQKPEGSWKRNQLFFSFCGELGKGDNYGKR
jgi:hypothetical protein